MPPLVDPTALLVALVLFLGGVLLLTVSADRLLRSLAAVGSAAGVSTYLLAVVLVAVDPGGWGFGVAAVLGGSPGVAAGSWLAARGAGDLAAGLGLDATAFGATFVGPLLSLEGVLVVLTPVRRGRPEVAAGALVAGSAVAALFLWQGRMTRARGAALLLLYLGMWILSWSPAG